MFAILFKILSFICVALSKHGATESDQEIKFLLGRIPPGRFEYPELNRYFSPKESVKICESDTSCGGFTFKGVTNSPRQEFETYFFHFVPKELFGRENSENQSFHWTSYLVQKRSFIELKNYQIQSSQNEEPRLCLKDRYFIL